MEVFIGGILALASALVGAVVTARFQTVSEHRNWLRDTQLRCYAEFADIARKAASATINFRDMVLDLPAGDALPEPARTTFVQSVDAIDVELDAKYGRIVMVGLPVGAELDRIMVTWAEFRFWVKKTKVIRAEGFRHHCLVSYGMVTDFIEKAQSTVASKRPS